MEDLKYKIIAVDPNDENNEAIIGRCFNLGLAKSWAEDTITIDDIKIVNANTNQQWYYCKKEKKWR